MSLFQTVDSELYLNMSEEIDDHIYNTIGTFNKHQKRHFGGNLYRLVAVSFGLLCILQAALNISLRLSLYDSDDNTTDPVAALRKVTKERDELKKKLTIFTEYSRQGWMYFNNSFYYISTLEKSWQDSRSDCQQRGADLMIINSIEEQNFTRSFCKHMWIGLTDQEKEGTWKWVDGTLPSTSYWGINEPNSHEGMDEDCGEIKFYDALNSWNDKPCQTKNTWMCEKTMVL
ncbi:CD209 antigen-like protein C [Larimichthys crocea]|uniref:CD209 antigen-like protein C n=1 Tax=Larimichthys crocea TaxID=215358 RepID=UPI000900D41D|nr:CD209 antigen-like protein C [Larimichthys crocea]